MRPTETFVFFYIISTSPFFVNCAVRVDFVAFGRHGDSHRACESIINIVISKLNFTLKIELIINCEGGGDSGLLLPETFTCAATGKKERRNFSCLKCPHRRFSIFGRLSANDRFSRARINIFRPLLSLINRRVC